MNLEFQITNIKMAYCSQEQQNTGMYALCFLLVHSSFFFRQNLVIATP